MGIFNFKLGAVKETLSREQMKQISGGVWCDYSLDTSNPQCPIDHLGDSDIDVQMIKCDGTDVSYCQGYEDATCEGDVCCTGVVCH